MKAICELVTAAELKPGDVVDQIIDNNWIEAATIKSVGQSDGEFIEIDFGKGSVRELDDALYWRRISATEDPRVLRRALENAIGDEYIGSPEDTANDYIEQARKELESEATE